MDAIRKAYQRAVQTPMENVKRLWEEYSEFETNLNKQLVSMLCYGCDRTEHHCLFDRQRNSFRTYRRLICRRVLC